MATVTFFSQFLERKSCRPPTSLWGLVEIPEFSFGCYDFCSVGLPFLEDEQTAGSPGPRSLPASRAARPGAASPLAPVLTPAFSWERAGPWLMSGSTGEKLGRLACWSVTVLPRECSLGLRGRCPPRAQQRRSRPVWVLVSFSLAGALWVSVLSREPA